MFTKSKTKENSEVIQSPGKTNPTSSVPVSPTLRFPKPKILLVDMRDNSEAVLRAAGYKISTGTFGTPYAIPQKSDSYRLVPREFSVPNYAEQEIVVIDLTPRPTLPKAEREPEEAVVGDYDFWAKCNYGVIDPRPAGMAILRSAFDRIVQHGGVFVVFADESLTAETIRAKSTNRGIEPIRNATYDAWSFLTMLDSSRFTTNFVQGSEINSSPGTNPLSKLIDRHIKGAHFTCTMAPTQTVAIPHEAYFENVHFKSWIVLATDKYGAAVSGVFHPQLSTKGMVFVFPQLSDKARFLAEFLRDVLPELAPELFPYAEPDRWMSRDEYQMPSVLAMKREIETIRAQSEAAVSEIESKMLELQQDTSYLVDLLSQTGDDLVKAVKRTLEVLGFDPVLDMDEELKNTAGSTTKREDLRILGDPTLLIEVKGINGLPADADALQVQKYVVVRMREWKRTNVQGLEIINHQKGLPPLDREHNMPFRQDIIVNAEDQQFGLITTWNLYRLARSFLANGWSPNHVKPLFFQFGHIRPVPIHYELLGSIEHYWEKVSAVGLRIEAGQLRKGDRLAFELPSGFEEQEVESLEVDNESVTTAVAPVTAGVRTHFGKKQVTKGTRVYRVIR
jgi:hypothetical protein